MDLGGHRGYDNEPKVTNGFGLENKLLGGIGVARRAGTDEFTTLFLDASS